MVDRPRFDGLLVGGRWKLGPKIAAGGQGSTYLARDAAAAEERVVVVKAYQLSATSGWKKYDLFQREVEVLGKLTHPAVPRFVATLEGEPAGTFYLVMERTPGKTLAALAEERPFTEPELRDLAVRVLDVLDYLHTHEPPIIHRDIKPANIVRDEDGSIHVVDFGGVRSALREGGGSTVVGTFGYMAPEQLHGQASAATDLYGLGATLVALAGGIEPEEVPRKGLRMDIAKHLKSAGLGSDFLRFLEKLTQPDPDDRPASAKDALSMLGDPDKLRAHLPHPTAEGEFSDLPPSAGAFMHFIMVLAGTAGYLSITIIQKVFIPILFAIVLGMSDEKHKPRIQGWRGNLDKGLLDARKEMHQLMKSGDSVPKTVKNVKGRKTSKGLPPRS